MRENRDERKNEPQALPYRGVGRPQIVLIGNGLERKDDSAAIPGCTASTGKSWADLLKDVTVENHLEFGKDDLANVPFPLKYHLLSTNRDAPYPLSASDRKREEDDLSKAAAGLGTVTNEALRRLPELRADHYFTTNYTYSLERAFDPARDFLNDETRRRARFNYNPDFTEKGRRRIERRYRLYTGYLAKLPGGGQAGLWHIHGECAVPGSIILGHDGYGRLLSRIVPVCGDGRKYHDLRKFETCGFRSWPELFLFADVYIVGLGLGVSEFDLWWLLRRKQREENADGRVYFYTNDAGKQAYRDRDLMLRALGVTVNPDGIRRKKSYEDFYLAALDSIQARIAENRDSR